MCTLSVIPRDSGFLIGMNRDEKVTRGAGVGPEIHGLHSSKAVYPSDATGGTWIAVNQSAVALALLNWNVADPHIEMSKRRSRGQVIPELIGLADLAEVDAGLRARNLATTLPFRLVAVSASEQEIREWRWDSQQIESVSHGWKLRHWFSSSLSDKQAESSRGAVCDDACNEPDAGSVTWLRRLHTSHAGGPGPFSLCVHRPDVETLSYTEIDCTPSSVRMKHFFGKPCTMRPAEAVKIAATSFELSRASAYGT